MLDKLQKIAERLAEVERQLPTRQYTVTVRP